MNFRRKNQVLSSFSAAPMNDILFFLLLFFLLTATFTIPTYVKVTLAASSGEQTIKQSIQVIITSDGKYMFEQQEIQKNDLPQILEKALGNNPDPVINLIVDRQATWDYMAGVLSIANKKKAQVVVATRKE